MSKTNKKPKIKRVAQPRKAEGKVTDTALAVLQSGKMTEAESLALAEQEEIIAAGLGTFVAVGRALAEIKEGRLYRASHPNFDTYCRERWGYGRHYADKLIGAVAVVANVDNCHHGAVAPPLLESHARALSALPAEEQGPVWAEVVRTAPKGVITATHTEKVVATKLPAKSSETRKRVQRVVLPAATPPTSPPGLPALDTTLDDDSPDSGTRAVTSSVVVFRESLTKLCDTFGLVPDDFPDLVRTHEARATDEEFLQALGLRAACRETQTAYDAVPKNDRKQRIKFRKEMDSAEKDFKAFLTDIQARSRS